jgi:hypothetical protein
MKYKIQLAAATLIALSSVAFAAETNKGTADRTTCCMVANGCVEHIGKDIQAADQSLAALDEAQKSNNPKKLHDAISAARKSISDIKTNESKTQLAMKALYDHLTKVEEKAHKLKAEQSSLDDLLNGDGLTTEFIIN